MEQDPDRQLQPAPSVQLPADRRRPHESYLRPFRILCSLMLHLVFIAQVAPPAITISQTAKRFVAPRMPPPGEALKIRRILPKLILAQAERGRSLSALGPVSGAWTVLPTSVPQTGSLRRRRLDDPHEPIDGEYVVVEEGSRPATRPTSRRPRLFARSGSLSQATQKLLALPARAQQDFASLGVLRAYLPYEECRGLLVDVLI